MRDGREILLLLTLLIGKRPEFCVHDLFVILSFRGEFRAKLTRVDLGIRW